MFAGKPRERDFQEGEVYTRIDLNEVDIIMRNLINSAQDRDYWEVLVNEELNLRVSLAMNLVKHDI